jgi:uncharacterized OsmC-like protein
MEDATFKISAMSKSPSRTMINVRQFELFIDEPEYLGGTDTAPNPVEMLLAAYAGCLNVMCFVVAKEMNFELRGVKMELEGALNPDRLYGKSFEQRAGYKEVSVKLSAETDADRDTLKEWIDAIKDRCPVGDNIGNETPIKLVLS